MKHVRIKDCYSRNDSPLLLSGLETIRASLKMIVINEKLKTFKKVYFYCCDPGAFYAAEPIHEKLKSSGKECLWIFDGWCATNKSISCNSITSEKFKEDIESIKSSDFCIFIGAQVNYKLNFQMIDFCRFSGIYSIFLFDYWSNYLNNFQDNSDYSLHLTDSVFIMDELAKSELIKELNPVIPDKSFFESVIIAGHQGIEKTVSVIREMSAETVLNFRQKVNPLNKKLVLFVLEPLEKDFGYLDNGEPFLGFNEFSAIEYFFSNMNYQDSKILIKPHPRHEKDKVRSFLEKNMAVRNFDYGILEKTDLNLLLNAADEVIGMTSTVLMIALKCGKKIRSIQVNRNANAVKISNPYLTPYLIEK